MTSRSISLYTGAPAAPAEILTACRKLATAFPNRELEFFNLLAERMVANRFTAERLRDAIGHVLDNFVFKDLNIAGVIRYDRRCQLLTHSEVSAIITSSALTFEHFTPRDINGRRYYIRNSELDQFAN